MTTNPKIGLIQIPQIHVRLSEIWNAPDYVIEMWKGGIKVDLDLANVHTDVEWKMLKSEVYHQVSNAIQSYIKVLQNDCDNINSLK
jgi:hypothetical protein